MNTTTTPAVTPVTPAQLDALLAMLTGICETRRARLYPNTTPETFSIQRGRKFARIVKHDGGSTGSAYGFVELATGRLLKSDGWKGPALNFARGTIHDLASVAKCCHPGGIG